LAIKIRKTTKKVATLYAHSRRQREKKKTSGEKKKEGRIDNKLGMCFFFFRRE
jgi:hypothetical protein